MKMQENALSETKVLRWVRSALALLMLVLITVSVEAQERQLLLVHAKKNKSKTLKAGDRIHYRSQGDAESTAGRIDSIGETSLWVEGEEVGLEDIVLIRKRDGKWKAMYIVGSGLLYSGLVWTQMGAFYFVAGVVTGNIIPVLAGFFDVIAGRAMLGAYFYYFYERGKHLDNGTWELIPGSVPLTS